MEPIVINATDVRTRTREIMERVKYKGDTFVVETFGQPTAVIVNVDEYKRMVSDFKQARDIRAQGLLCSSPKVDDVDRSSEDETYTDRVDTDDKEVASSVGTKPPSLSE